MITEERVQVGGTFWVTEYVVKSEGREYRTQLYSEAVAKLQRWERGCVGLFHSMPW